MRRKTHICFLNKMLSYINFLYFCIYSLNQVGLHIQHLLMPRKKQTNNSTLSFFTKIIVIPFCNQINLCNSLFAHPAHLSLMDFVKIIMENKLNKWNKITQV